MNYRERIKDTLGSLQGQLFRVVESQEDIATTRIVDNMQEQARLEQLLDASKPTIPEQASKLHYLLATPFRYPPLKYGSRFGRSFEPSLFYGAMSIPTALAETAFYRFVFTSHVSAPFKRPLTTLHTVFTARFRSSRGVRLQAHEWQDLQETLTDPVSYRESQALGSDLRQCGAEAFQFLSARALQAGLYQLPWQTGSGMDGLNVALFSPRALRDTAPRSYHKLIVATSDQQVSMSLTLADGSKQVHNFGREAFLVEGVIPQPAL